MRKSRVWYLAAITAFLALALMSAIRETLRITTADGCHVAADKQLRVDMNPATFAIYRIPQSQRPRHRACQLRCLAASPAKIESRTKPTRRM
jgi:hypothetical protein